MPLSVPLSVLALFFTTPFLFWPLFCFPFCKQVCFKPPCPFLSFYWFCVRWEDGGGGSIWQLLEWGAFSALLSIACSTMWPGWRGHDLPSGYMFLMLSCHSQWREQHPQWSPPAHYIMLDPAYSAPATRAESLNYRPQMKGPPANLGIFFFVNIIWHNTHIQNSSNLLWRVLFFNL